MNFENSKKLIEKVNNISIVSHVNPDGDAIGSSYALYFALKKINKNVSIIMKNYSDSFKFLPDIDCNVNSMPFNTELLIVTDCSDYTRANVSSGELESVNESFKIDHHQVSSKLKDIDIVDSTSISTCSIMYEFIKYLNIEIDKKIATYLYMGIMTDSGNFSYENTKPKDLLIASKLMEKGIDFCDISRKLNNTIKENKLKLIVKCIDNMESYLDGRIKYTYASQKILKKFNINDEDAEGIVNYLNDIENGEMSIYVREKTNKENKVSMRSRGNVDVSKIAILFGGGGHKRASGYTMKDRLSLAKKKLLNKAKEEVLKVGENDE